ncbi:MAG: hypothetical protein MUO78_06710, partial [candidate division Zixibacteria bacterium]|nr:hypothetical protein [candidate division Zixibacteria bacterium]
MKNLTILLTGFGLGLILVACGFEKSSAEEKGIASQIDTLLGGQVIISQPVEVEAKRNFIYIEPGPVKPDKIAGEIFAGG